MMGVFYSVLDGRDEYDIPCDWARLDCDGCMGPCTYCDGDGFGIVGTDWDCEDGINGPYDGETEECPNCHGTGRAKDMAFW